ncbi:MAG: hypothetical protein LBH43_04080 [Treponema sp.]|jgi:hypothetical protein|nr:hypothetical protein [Treponema sp.]
METELKRTGSWHFSDFAVLDSSGANITHGYCRAVFHAVDKSSHSEENEIHRIIYNKNTLNVLWADFGNYSNSDLIEENEKEDIFISHNDYVYRFEYIPPTLISLYKNPDSQQTKLENTDDETLDKYVSAFCEENDHGFWSDTPYSKSADITACLDRLLRKGLKWKYGRLDVINGKAITKLKGLCAKNNVFEVIIENDTFIKPKTGIVYLDIEKFEISDGKERIVAMEDYEEPCFWGMYIPRSKLLHRQCGCLTRAVNKTTMLIHHLLGRFKMKKTEKKTRALKGGASGSR